MDSVYTAASDKQITVLVGFDLSAVSDKASHDTLLERLQLSSRWQQWCCRGSGPYTTASTDTAYSFSPVRTTAMLCYTMLWPALSKGTASAEQWTMQIGSCSKCQSNPMPSDCFVNCTSCQLTPSTPDVPNCCCLKGSAPYWSNPPFLTFDIRRLWRSRLAHDWAPERPNVKN